MTKSHSLAPISCGYILVQNAFSQTSKVPVVFQSQCCLRVQNSKSFLKRKKSIVIYYRMQKSITYFQHIIPTYNTLRKDIGNTLTKQGQHSAGQIPVPLVAYLISSSYYSSTVRFSCLQSLSDWVHAVYSPSWQKSMALAFATFRHLQCNPGFTFTASHSCLQGAPCGDYPDTPLTSVTMEEGSTSPIY